MVLEKERGGLPNPQVLETLNLPETFGPKIQSKVRDIWVLPDGRRIMVTTDRQSAYDKVVCLTPGKGRLLNMLSAWWFEKTQDIIPNHMLKVPHVNVMICQECKPIPLEMVVRGFITGESDTSLWKNYRDKTKVYSWLDLPGGLLKNQKLPETVVTPTTKEGEGRHDEPVSPLQAAGIVGEVYWQMQDKSLRLFKRASEIYEKAGLLLVDTKFEFGLDRDGRLTLIDELFTPDSSRIWEDETYEERFSQGQEPDGLDKEFLRLWLKNQGFTGQGEVPAVPAEITNRLAALYVVPFQRLTCLNLGNVSSSPINITTGIVHYLAKGI